MFLFFILSKPLQRTYLSECYKYIYIYIPPEFPEIISVFFLNPKLEPVTSGWDDMEWPEYNKSKASYLSTPVVSPCKTLCQLTGRYSTLPIMLESSLCLKWLFMRLSEAFRNSLTAAENEKNKMRKTTSEYFFIENGTIKCYMSQTWLANSSTVPKQSTILKCGFSMYSILDNKGSPHWTMPRRRMSQAVPIPWTMNTRWPTFSDSPTKIQQENYNKRQILFATHI